LFPLMGSGSTTLACARWDKDRIGIELEHRYYESAPKRVADFGTDLYVSSVVDMRAV